MSVQPYDQMADQIASSRVNSGSRIQENIQNLFHSIAKNNVEESDVYHGTLKQEAARKQKAFDEMKEELQIAQHRNAHKSRDFSNGINIHGKVVAKKRETKEESHSAAIRVGHFEDHPAAASPSSAQQPSESFGGICHALVTHHLSTFVNKISHIIREQAQTIDESVYRNLFERLLTEAGMKPASSTVLSERNLLAAIAGETLFIFKFEVNRTAEEALREVQKYRTRRFHGQDEAETVLCVGINYRYIESRHETRDWLICSWVANFYRKNGILLTAFPPKQLVHPTPIEVRRESFDDDYEMLEQVGTGSFGVVYKCRQRSTGYIFAAKIIDVGAEPDLRVDTRREMEIMGQLHHKNLLELVAAYEEAEKMVMVVEFLTGGQLNQRDRMSELEVAYHVRQICEAVQYMHERNIFHFNIGPENIMCRTNLCTQIKLIDFGLAMKYDAYIVQHLNSSIDSLEDVFFEVFGFYSDMRDVGILTYFLLTGMRPTFDNEEDRNFNDIENSFQKFSKDCKNFVGRLLVDDDRQRMTVHQSLSHPWLNQNPEEIESLIL